MGYLLDHIVAGRSILPGAAMFEAAAAAARTLADAGAAAVHGEACLLDVAIPAPVALHAAQMPGLECIVDCRTGSIQLHKASPGVQILRLGKYCQLGLSR